MVGVRRRAMLGLPHARAHRCAAVWWVRPGARRGASQSLLEELLGEAEWPELQELCVPAPSAE